MTIYPCKSIFEKISGEINRETLGGITLYYANHTDIVFHALKIMNRDINVSKVKERNREMNFHPIYRSKAILEYHASDAKQAIEPSRYISKSNHDHKRNINQNGKAQYEHSERRSINTESSDSEEDHESRKHSDESYWTEHQSDQSFESYSLDQNSQCSFERTYTSQKKQQQRRQPRRKRAEHKRNDTENNKRCTKLLNCTLGFMIVSLSVFVILIKTGVMERLLFKRQDRQVGEIYHNRTSQSLQPSAIQITSPSMSPSDVPSETPTHHPTFGYGVWTESSNIQGDELYGMLGRSIALDSSGKYIAISLGFDVPKVTVYRAYYDVWIPVGESFMGPSGPEGEYFGSTIRLVKEGTIVAIGNMFHNGTIGIVQVYSWNNEQWSQVGQDLTGNKTNDGFGRSIALSNSGNKICIGSALIDDGAPGSVECFYLNGNTWVQGVLERGGEMHAISSNNRGLSITNDGSFFAFTAPGVSIYRDDASYVKVFRWDDGTGLDSKEMVGGLIMTFRRPLSLDMVRTSNDQYLILAVGTPELENTSGATDPNGAGGVQVYYLDLTDTHHDWKEKGELIMCNDCGTNFGRRLSLSSDGSALVITSNTAVIFYDWTGSKWKERGYPTTSRVFQTVKKSIPNADIGYNEGNGITLAMALSLDEDGYGGYDRGKVKFYQWD